jgi:anti-anti-sigma regulatory factor
MSAVATHQAHIGYQLIDEHHPDVTVIEFLSRDVVGPTQARELREQLESLDWSGFPQSVVIDFQNVRSLGSSAFGVIASFVRRFARVRVCNISNSLRLGASLIGLDDRVEFAASRDAAIRAAVADARRGQDDTEDYPIVTG